MMDLESRHSYIVMRKVPPMMLTHQNETALGVENLPDVLINVKILRVNINKLYVLTRMVMIEISKMLFTQMAFHIAGWGPGKGTAWELHGSAVGMVYMWSMWEQVACLISTQVVSCYWTSVVIMDSHHV